jgi:hypothetical protein
MVFRLVLHLSGEIGREPFATKDSTLREKEEIQNVVKLWEKILHIFGH